MPVAVTEREFERRYKSDVEDVLINNSLAPFRNESWKVILVHNLPFNSRIIHNLLQNANSVGEQEIVVTAVVWIGARQSRQTFLTDSNVDSWRTLTELTPILSMEGTQTVALSKSWGFVNGALGAFSALGGNAKFMADLIARLGGENALEQEFLAAMQVQSYLADERIFLPAAKLCGQIGWKLRDKLVTPNINKN